MIYRLLKFMTTILGIGAAISIIIYFGFCSYTIGILSWEKIKLEHIDTIKINMQQEEVSETKEPYTINAERMAVILENNEEIDNPSCFEIRNGDDWAYVKSALNIEDNNINLDFPNYYIISFGWEIDSLECQRAKENSQEVVEGRSVKKEDSYQEGVIHIYKIEKNVIMKCIK